MSKKEEVLQSLKENNIKYVRFLYVDNDNVIRGYMGNAKSMDKDLDSGFSVSKAMPFFTAFDHLVPDTNFSYFGELRIVPDLDTFRILPYAERTAAVICDFKTVDLKPSNVCARTKLKEILKQSEYEVYVGIENEFYFLTKDAEGKYIPADSCLCFATTGMNQWNELVLELTEVLEEQGIEVEKYYPEYGPGQQEIVFKCDKALKTADNQIIFRETVRAIGNKYGVTPCFMPKPFNNLAGSGAHLNISLWKDGKNVFFAKEDKFGLSQKAYHFIGGILKHIRQICAFTASTITSYKRLIPHSWASAFGCYGMDNREAAIRIPSTQYSNEEKTARIEFKPIDPACNPYLALAAVIAAGLDGIHNKLDPGKPLEVDPGYLSKEERESLGIKPFPRNLFEALQELDKSEFFRNLFGNEMVDEYIKMKMHDWNEYMLHVTDWERERYVDIF